MWFYIGIGFMVLWLAIGYYVTGAHVAYSAAIARYKRKKLDLGSPAEALFFGFLTVTVLWPLILYCFRTGYLIPDDGTKNDDQFFEDCKDCLKKVRSSFLDPKKVDFLWPWTIIKT
ncbi:MAG: hypothetical protein WCT49_01375 [Candidatus Paceibacterota bacterium]|jgi:hypothetical protein|nr:hypothetical protein [Candidatus Paceibacterota bacterium]